MIERIYGWGSGSVLMPKPKRDGRKRIPVRTRIGVDLRRHLIDDVPWRTLAASFSLSFAGLLILYALHTQLPALTRETASVVVAVRFLEQPAEPVPPARVEPQQPAVRRKDSPPKSAPVVSTPPRRAAEAPAPAPAPNIAAPSPVTEITSQQRADEGRVTLGPHPDLSPPSLRTGQDGLPPSAVAVFSSAREHSLDLGETALSSRLPPNRRAELPMSESAPRRESVAVQKGTEVGALPEAKIAPLRQRAALEGKLPESKSALHGAAASPAQGIALPSAPASPRKTDQNAHQVAPGHPTFEIVDRDNPSVLDRSRLVSLTELRTCVDPQAETNLRTRLATLLSRPTLCRSGGLYFDFHHPESAWSIRVDIYNYEGATFGDRCAALQRAVECSENARRTPL